MSSRMTKIMAGAAGALTLFALTGAQAEPASTHWEYLRPLVFEHNVQTANAHDATADRSDARSPQAKLVDESTGSYISGSSLSCDENGENCTLVRTPLEASFKLANEPAVKGTTGLLPNNKVSPAQPDTTTLFAARLKPQTLGHNLPLVISFAGNDTYGPASTTVYVDVWERIDPDATGAGTVYVSPSQREFRIVTATYDSGIVTTPADAFRAQGPVTVLNFNGTDANGDSLTFSGVMRNGQQHAAFSGVGAGEPLAFVVD